MTHKALSLVWFRQDLRLIDNEALCVAASRGPFFPIYIHDECAPLPFKRGQASNVWLHHSLQKLNVSFKGRLNIYKGPTKAIFNQLIALYPLDHIFYNRCYEPWHIIQEKQIQKWCGEKRVSFTAFNSNYLRVPEAVLKDDGSFYKVFSAYKKKAFSILPRKAIKRPLKIEALSEEAYAQSLDDLALIPPHHTWPKTTLSSWSVGEAAAQKKLQTFIHNKLAGYKEGRHYPFDKQTSLLSVHLHFGEISPASILEAVYNAAGQGKEEGDGAAFGALTQPDIHQARLSESDTTRSVIGQHSSDFPDSRLSQAFLPEAGSERDCALPKTEAFQSFLSQAGLEYDALLQAETSQAFLPEADCEHFISELMWREFSTYLLYHFNTLHKENFNPRFDQFPWQDHPVFLRAWQRGQTGYPLVDAGMRQLWQTGFMHNRVRMITASFLVKNLKIHWHHGRDWFWECLFDADLANNSASWQWVAGSGVDASPYFRIFNPITQGKKFDPQGAYIKKFVPELKRLPLKYLFNPNSAPKSVLHEAGIILGKTYPKPLVDLKESRDQALKAYRQMRYGAKESDTP